MTRVAHLTTVDSSLQYLLLPQLLAVLEAGGEAIGISAPGPCVEHLEAHGIRHIALAGSTRGMDVRSDARAARHLWRILREERIDVLHTHNPKPGLYGRAIGRIARVPVVVNTVHGFYASDDDAWPKRALVYGLEGIASRCSDLELYQNIEDLTLAQRTHLVPRGRARLLGNGVDLARFDPARSDLPSRAAVRSSIGVREESVVVGTVARLVAEKGFPELFAAVRGLGPRVELVVVGPDDPEKPDRLPRDLVAAAAADGVRFLGMRDDVDALYRAFDVFVLASHREGFPRAAMEAAAMGLPIVATNVRGCRQVVADGDTGLLVPVHDADALRRAIESLARAPDVRARMGRAARHRALESFDERDVVARVMDAYGDVAARKRLRLFG